MRSGHSNGSTRYQPYTIEIVQASSNEAVYKKYVSRSEIDFTKDKMMRLRFKCIPYSNTGEVIYYADLDGPYLDQTIGSTAYYYKVVPRICTATTFSVTLTSPGDGHPY